MSRVPIFTCELCARPSSRMFGVIAAVKLPDGTPSPRSRVLAYCAAHKSDVVPTYMAGLAEEGDDVALVSDPPAELRPADADHFLAWADQLIANILEEALGVNAFEHIDPEAGPPEDCPHCGYRLSWGTGPHQGDAVARGALAWQCPGCGAAGMLTRLPTG